MAGRLVLTLMTPAEEVSSGIVVFIVVGGGSVVIGGREEWHNFNQRDL